MQLSQLEKVLLTLPTSSPIDCRANRAKGAARAAEVAGGMLVCRRWLVRRLNVDG